MKKLGDMLSYFVEYKKVYYIVFCEEMEKVISLEYYGDVCLFVKKNCIYSLEGYL